MQISKERIKRLQDSCYGVGIVSDTDVRWVSHINNDFVYLSHSPRALKYTGEEVIKVLETIEKEELEAGQKWCIYLGTNNKKQKPKDIIGIYSNNKICLTLGIN